MLETCSPGSEVDCTPVCETEVRILINPMVTPPGSKLVGSLGYGFEYEEFVNPADPDPVLAFQVDGANIYGTVTLIDQNGRIVYVDDRGGEWVNLNTDDAPKWVRTEVFEPSAYTTPRTVDLASLSVGDRFRLLPGGDVWRLSEIMGPGHVSIEMCGPSLIKGVRFGIARSTHVYPEGGV